MTIVEMAKWVLFYISIHLKNDGCFRKGDQICSEDVANQIHDKMTLRTIRISTQHHLFVADHLIRVVQSEVNDGSSYLVVSNFLMDGQANRDRQVLSKETEQ